MEAKPPFRFRKLRIAWSVAWAIVALLILALWVRSYVVYDHVVVHYPSGLEWFIAYSNKGVYIVSTYGLLAPHATFRGGLLGEVGGVRRSAYHIRSRCSVVCTVSIAPWIHYRFSLRTLLIATTLVAVVLGLIMWAANIMACQFETGIQTVSLPADTVANMPRFNLRQLLLATTLVGIGLGMIVFGTDELTGLGILLCCQY